eukprot:scaffold3929_cov291-Pinguiococcus_pyrenoidosus.AAC.7
MTMIRFWWCDTVTAACATRGSGHIRGGHQHISERPSGPEENICCANLKISVLRQVEEVHEEDVRGPFHEAVQVLQEELLFQPQHLAHVAFLVDALDELAEVLALSHDEVRVHAVGVDEAREAEQIHGDTLVHEAVHVRSLLLPQLLGRVPLPEAKEPTQAKEVQRLLPLYQLRLGPRREAAAADAVSVFRNQAGGHDGRGGPSRSSHNRGEHA